MSERFLLMSIRQKEFLGDLKNILSVPFILSNLMSYSYVIIGTVITKLLSSKLVKKFIIRMLVSLFIIEISATKGYC